MAASSRTRISPARRPPEESRLRRASWTNLATVSAGIPASSASTPAATAETARPRTGVPPAAQASRAALIMRVFPPPAAPTTQTEGDLGRQRRGQGDDLGMGEDGGGGGLDPRPAGLRPGGPSRREKPGDGLGDLGSAPRRAGLGQLGDHVADQLGVGKVLAELYPGPMERVGQPPVGIPSGEVRFCPPPSAQG